MQRKVANALESIALHSDERERPLIFCLRVFSDEMTEAEALYHGSIPHTDEDMLNAAAPGKGNGGEQVWGIVDAFKASSKSKEGEDLSTGPFLEAFVTLTSFFDAIGSPYIAALLRREIVRKTSLIQASVKKHSVDDVRVLVATEQMSTPKASAKAPPRPVAALIWIDRVILFVETLLANLTANDGGDVSVSTAASDSYQHSALRESQSNITRAIFQRALEYLPTRESFNESIGKDDTPLLELLVQLRWHTAVLQSCLEQDNYCA